MEKQEIRVVAFRTALLTSIVTSVVLFILPLNGLLGSRTGQQDTLRVRVIKLVGEDGNERGELGVRNDGSSYIRLGNERGTFWVQSYNSDKPDGGNVQLHIGGAGRGYMRLTSGEYGNAGPLIYMVNKQCKLALATGLWGENGEGYLRIDDYDPTQKGVYSRKGVMDKVENVSLMVVDNEGHVTWAAPESGRRRGD